MRDFGAMWLLAGAALAMQPAAVPAKPAPPKAALVVPADYTPRPAIWLLADEDTQIYMLGTIHMLEPGFRWRSPALDAVAKRSSELVVETLGPEDMAEGAEMALLQSLMLDSPSPILERVPKKDRKKLKAALAKAGMKVEDTAMLKSWAVAVFLGISQSLDGWGAADPAEAPGVEDVLEAEFKTAGKPILAIETPQAALEAFDALSQEEQTALLREALAPPNSAAQDESSLQDRLWATGRFEEVYDEFRSELPPILYQGLVVKRNAAWTEWLVERMKKPGTLLLAVGAGHLAGDDSVQRMLAARGLKVTRHD
jgi:uncharacterized protein